MEGGGDDTGAADASVDYDDMDTDDEASRAYMPLTGQDPAEPAVEHARVDLPFILPPVPPQPLLGEQRPVPPQSTEPSRKRAKRASTWPAAEQEEVLRLHSDLRIGRRQA